MQTKPFGLIEAFYLKPCLVSENMFDAGLKFSVDSTEF
jgi:hypothetical protein